VRHGEALLSAGVDGATAGHSGHIVGQAQLPSSAPWVGNASGYNSWSGKHGVTYVSTPHHGLYRIMGNNAVVWHRVDPSGSFFARAGRRFL
jgi:hypothetical protein